MILNKEHKFILFVLIVVLKSAFLFGQADSLKHCTCEEDTMILFDFAERMPGFPGGEIKLLNFLNDNTKYPQEAIEQNIEGTVILRLCILETGEVSDITVVRGSYKILNDEAIRVVKLMPGWIPALHNGKPICMRFILPIRFKIDSFEKKHKVKKRHRNAYTY